ncbi:unnamed protein product [Linum tenue]|uniref:Uncharacterized protein n=1 Tax=Linum tenue TaxID=586396 RepID=A0AAV0R209_9ROSI|nr:unnamed protein product [Linum tenue]
MLYLLWEVYCSQIGLELRCTYSTYFWWRISRELDGWPGEQLFYPTCTVRWVGRLCTLRIPPLLYEGTLVDGSPYCSSGRGSNSHI